MENSDTYKREINSLGAVLNKFNMKEGMIISLNEKEDIVIDNKKDKNNSVYRMVFEGSLQDKLN